ncbi:class IV adenylate cyclase [Thermomonospora cellulosilytica]|uniref:Adenylate cyclase class 2 n=1 Tax=Thermomonospora cellulosilytica TaxID=1411118 RepID=A0A7W3MXW2_9ACTN|nr:class IV adenylate cyclase [Thermomonospora cellulosilytica]MBA9003935.1 adenylate cyclase class 2 [Thermomonospora cellulosilytica]
MIEAELKARVRDPEGLRARLRERADEELSVYRDTYYDRPDGTLTGEGRELRVRVVETGGVRRTVLTYKEPPVDAASGSKPEHETKVADPAVIDTVLRALGAVEYVSLTKHCANYRFTARGRDMLATVVTVPELNGTFVELETMADPGDVESALADVRAVLAELGVTKDDLTTEQYTDAVLQARL